MVSQLTTALRPPPSIVRKPTVVEAAVSADSAEERQAYTQNQQETRKQMDCVEVLRVKQCVRVRVATPKQPEGEEETRTR